MKIHGGSLSFFYDSVLRCVPWQRRADYGRTDGRTDLSMHTGFACGAYSRARSRVYRAPTETRAILFAIVSLPEMSQQPGTPSRVTYVQRILTRSSPCRQCPINPTYSLEKTRVTSGEFGESVEFLTADPRRAALKIRARSLIINCL